MSGDMHVPGSVRPVQLAVLLDHRHFKANRLFKLSQIEEKKGCPKALKLEFSW